MTALSPEASLLPCPFCGTEPQYLTEHGQHVIMCTFYHCQAATIGLSNKEAAIKNWNTRAPAAPVAP